MSLHLTQKRILYLQEAFCISVAMCIGISITLGFQLYNGYWIPMTTAIMFIGAGQGQGAIIRKSLERAVGTLTGAAICFLFVNIFMYGNYHWSNLMPVLWFLGWYAFFVTDNYAFFAVMITMFVPILLCLMTMGSFSMTDTLIKRIACTLLGISIALITEFIIYKNATSAKHEIKQSADNVFHGQGEIIRLASDYFLNESYEAGFVFEEFQKTIWALISNISSLEKFYLCIRYESGFQDNHKMFYQCFFKHFIEINRMTRRIVGIMGHDKFDESILNIEVIRKLGVDVSEKYKNMQLYFNGKTDDTSAELLEVLNKCESKQKSNPTCIFLKVLYKLSMHADNLSLAVYSRKYD